MAAKQAPSALGPILAWIGVLWLVFGADVLLTHQLAPRTPPWEADYFASLFGIEPLVLKRLPCIFTAPFIHANPAHLIANSIALFVLAWPCWRYSRRLTLAAVAYAVIYGGILAWTLGGIGAPKDGSPVYHIGASGVAFGLIGFLLGNGVFRRGLVPLLLGIATAVLFGGALSQAVPDTHSAVPVSWQMHLGGLLGGLSAAWHTRERSP